MKTRIKLFGIVIFLATILTGLSSCSKDSDWWNNDPGKRLGGISATIQNLNYPAFIQAGKQVELKADFWKPQPCYSLIGVNTRIAGFELEVDVRITRDHDDPCADVLVGETAKFRVVFPYPGKYLVKFKGPEGPESFEITVN